MKIGSRFTLRNIAGENIVIMSSALGVDATKVISLNESAAWLWTQLQGREFEIEEAVSLVLENYEVSEDIARADVERWVDTLVSNGVCE